jgi:hypothetical protein
MTENLLESKGCSKSITAFLGGAVFVSILMLLAVLLQVIQIGQAEIHANTDNETNATVVAIQERQREALEAIITIQAEFPADSNDGPSATLVSQQVAGLESTIEALAACRKSRLEQAVSEHNLIFSDDNTLVTSS